METARNSASKKLRWSFFHMCTVDGRWTPPTIGDKLIPPARGNLLKMGIYIYKTPYYWIDDYLPFLMEIMGSWSTRPDRTYGGDYPWASRYLLIEIRQSPPGPGMQLKPIVHNGINSLPTSTGEFTGFLNHQQNSTVKKHMKIWTSVAKMKRLILLRSWAIWDAEWKRDPWNGWTGGLQIGDLLRSRLESPG